MMKINSLITAFLTGQIDLTTKSTQFAYSGRAQKGFSDIYPKFPAVPTRI
jgi:hypothetical protein